MRQRSMQSTRLGQDGSSDSFTQQKCSRLSNGCMKPCDLLCALLRSIYSNIFKFSQSFGDVTMNLWQFRCGCERSLFLDFKGLNEKRQAVQSLAVMST